MHTQSTGTGGGGSRAFGALAAVLCLTFAAALLLPTTAGAGVHSFTAVKVKKGVATFKIKRARALKIRSAKVITRTGKARRISTGRVHWAARKGVLRVRIARKHSHKRRHARLRVRSRAGKSGRHKRQRERRTRHKKDGQQGSPSQPTQPGSPSQPSQPSQPGNPPKDPTLVIGTDEDTQTSGGSCAGGSAATFSDPSGFGYPNWPSACWRPFADGTPFNQRISGNARLLPNSSQIAANLSSLGVTRGRAGIADTCDDYSKVLYWAKSADPVWTIRGGSSVTPYDIDGAQVRMPESARPAGCTQAGGSDRHLAVIWNGYEYGMWNVRIDRASHTIYPSTGRKLPLSGDGLNGACTNARFGCLAGRIRFQELEAGRIEHALFATSDHLRTGFSYPAMQGSTNHPGLNGDWPQNGTRVQLDPSYATDAWLAQFPAWKQAILRALRDYGAYFGDDSGSPFSLTSFESGTGYTAFGVTDPFADYARSHLGQGISQSGGVYSFDVQSGVDWSRLRVVDPCVAQRTC